MKKKILHGILAGLLVFGLAFTGCEEHTCQFEYKTTTQATIAAFGSEIQTCTICSKTQGSARQFDIDFGTNLPIGGIRSFNNAIDLYEFWTDDSLASGNYAVLITTDLDLSNDMLGLGVDDGSGIAISLRGAIGATKVKIESNYVILQIINNEKVILRNIILSSDISMFAVVESSSTFEMKEGAVITGGAMIGVSISDGGEFIMHNGEIYGNDSGVLIYDEGKFTMHGGEIYENVHESVTLSGSEFIMHGGKIYETQNGVIINDESEFIMHDGEIYGNSFCGVFIDNESEFIMHGGKIYGNSFYGVYSWSGKFTMDGGEIYGNDDTGVFVGGPNAVFAKNPGGVIYGTDGNKANTEYAVLVESLAYRETTVTSAETLKMTIDTNGGGIASQQGTWDIW
ncbi:MAG: right-handed parallel beta-helix repeat-containing protein [Treponema sp.]|jgi:hypothetical protein|nr:right-handed parallel beta-helix repeat-containing protein [Treponema sp.]